jgi:hypothetical protein
MPEQTSHSMNPNKIALFTLFTLLFIVLISCGERESDENGPKRYFDLKGFVENQIVYLDEKKPEVDKSASLDGEVKVIRTRDIDWKKELELFVQADINKPAYAQSYDVIRKDSLTYEYKLKANTDLPVRYLKIVSDTSIKSPVKVIAVLESRNRIYESQKNIELTCSKKDNLWHLSTYTVKGYQKLIFMDPKEFEISSKIGL